MAATTLSAEKTRVPGKFNLVAGHYDVLTRMNPGYVAHLRASARRLDLRAGARALDLCCGTGLSTQALADVWPTAQITALDASAGMLDVARGKPLASRVEFVHGDAMAPQDAGVTGPFDGILMAYGIRNMPDADACLANLFTLLAPGGTICFHEYSVRDSRRAKLVWNAVTCGVIIPAGMVTSPRSDIYRYLRRSVLDFDGVSAFESRLRRHGFESVRTEPMTGWQRGIVHSFIARRPSE